MDIQQVSDVELLKEAKRRWNGSCLHLMIAHPILNVIGLNGIKEYLDNLELKVIKKPRRK